MNTKKKPTKLKALNSNTEKAFHSAKKKNVKNENGKTTHLFVNFPDFPSAPSPANFRHR